MAEATSVISILVQARDEASRVISRISGDVQEAGVSFSDFVSKADAAAGAIAAIGAVGFGIALKEFDDMAVALLKTDILLRDTGFSMEDVKKKAEEMSKSSTFGASDIVLVLARNVSLYKDMGKAIEQTRFAMDIAAFSGMNLESAQRLISRASDENVMALKKLADQLGVYVGDIDEHADKTVQMGILMDRIREKVSGYDATLLGASGTRQLTKELRDLAEQIGGIVNPIITKLIVEHIKPAIAIISEWITKHPELALQIVDTTLKIVLFATAIKALIALGPVLTLTFATAKLVMVGFVAVIGTIPAIVATAVVALAGLIAVANQAIQLQKELAAQKSSAKGQQVQLDANMQQVKALKAQGKTDEAMRLYSKTLQLNPGMSAPPFAELAAGGVVTRPTFAMIGEGGQPEAIIPLNRAREFGFGGGSGITVVLNGDVIGDEEAAKRWGDQLARVILNQLNLAVRA